MDIDSIATLVGLQRGHLDTIPGTDVRPSPIHGRGLFARTRIPAGRVLVRLDGQRLAIDDAPGALEALEWNAVSTSELLVRPIRTSYGFVNHSRTPNVRIDPASFDMIAMQEIAPDAELLINYLDQPLPDAYLRLPAAEYLRG